MALCVRNCSAALDSGVRAHGGRLANNEVVGEHGLMLLRLCRWFGRQVSVGCPRQSQAKQQQPGGCVSAAADGIVRAELWRSPGVRRACARRSPREQHCGWIAAFISAARSSLVWQAGRPGRRYCWARMVGLQPVQSRSLTHDGRRLEPRRLQTVAHDGRAGLCFAKCSMDVNRVGSLRRRFAAALRLHRSMNWSTDAERGRLTRLTHQQALLCCSCL